MGFDGWVDCHSHLADPRWAEGLDEALAEARRLGIGFFLQGGVGPLDWEAQMALRERYHEVIGLCFGLHPYWVADHDEDLCEIALDGLASKLADVMALGETGLDFRPHIMKDSRERQIDCFHQQLEMAAFAAKPVVLHLVQAQDEALRVVDLVGLPAEGGFIHSFNGSWSAAQEWTRRGLLISVGGPVARRNNAKLHEAVRRLPLEYLLLETDSPDQPPEAYRGERNPPASLWEVARAVAELRGMTPTEILDISTANFRRLFRI